MAAHGGSDAYHSATASEIAGGTGPYATSTTVVARGAELWADGAILAGWD